jgi:hypothetical protein
MVTTAAVDAVKDVAVAVVVDAAVDAVKDVDVDADVVIAAKATTTAVVTVDVASSTSPQMETSQVCKYGGIASI